MHWNVKKQFLVLCVWEQSGWEERPDKEKETVLAENGTNGNRISGF